MYVAAIAAEDFRNYERLDVELDPALNVVVGRNAQGKTNLLEAVYCLTGLGSPRSPDALLVRDGCEAAVLHGVVVRGSRRVRLDLELRPGRGARALINRTAVSGTRLLTDVVTAVFFGPEDPWLVKGPPDGRRSFVDDLAVKLRPARHAVRREWERVLKQRNTLLRTAPRSGPEAAAALATLEVWDESMTRAGARLTTARLEVLAALAPYASKRYEAVAGGGRLELGFQSAWLDDDLCAQALASPGAVSEESVSLALQEALADVRARELERGLSLVGPQRDDVAVALVSAEGSQPRDARLFASQGDQRTAALALKLGEHDLLSATLGESPVLLLDDVFSELDPARRAWLSEAVGDIGQTVVSAAEPGVVEVAQAARVLEVGGGRVRVRD